MLTNLSLFFGVGSLITITLLYFLYDRYKRRVYELEREIKAYEAREKHHQRMSRISRETVDRINNGHALDELRQHDELRDESNL